MTVVFNQEWSLERRRVLRNGMTRPEIILWMELKDDQVGVRFRRQYGINKYIVDFYAPKIKLVIEVDGSQHFAVEARQYDTIRTGSFESIGIQVIRFTNEEVDSDLEGVVDRIHAAIADRMARSPSF